MIYRLFVIMLAFTSALSADEPGYQFLKVGVTARATALGDAFTARQGDVTTVMYNPASIGFLDGRQAAVSYMDHLLDIGSGYVGYAQPWADYGVFGSSLVYFNYGDFEGYDVNGDKTASFSAGDWAWSVFYANQVADQWSYGVSLKYIYSSIQDYSSSAVAMDLGAQYHYKPLMLQAGISLLNIGQVTKSYIHKKDPLPFSMQIGVAKKLENAPITVSAHWVDLQDISSAGDLIRRLSVSAELNPKEPLFIRAGYNHQRHRDLNLNDKDFISRVAGLSAGIGYTYDRYTFDYSFTSWGIGTLNRFTFSMKW